MGQETKKYHITDNGEIFEVKEDGTVVSLGSVESIKKEDVKDKKASLTQSKQKWTSICVYVGLFIMLICMCLSEERFFRYGFSESLHVFFFDSLCWTIIVAFICAFLSIRLARTKPQNKFLRYFLFLVGILFIQCGEMMNWYSFYLTLFTVSFTIVFWAMSLNTSLTSKTNHTKSEE